MSLSEALPTTGKLKSTMSPLPCLLGLFFFQLSITVRHHPIQHHHSVLVFLLFSFLQFPSITVLSSESPLSIRVRSISFVSFLLFALVLFLFQALPALFHL